MAGDSRRKLHAYIGMPMLGRTQSLLPVHACAELIITVPALGNLTPETGCTQPR